MTSRLGWLLCVLTRRIWFRASLFSLGAIATALVAIPATPYIPAHLPTKIGADAVDNILGIIASSMLAVTTFSLNINRAEPRESFARRCLQPSFERRASLA